MKQASRIFFLIFCIIILIQCKSKPPKKNPILLAEREAPLGWVYLRIYEDSTFEFESRGMERKGDIYPGMVKIVKDTMFFTYSNAVPKAGDMAVYNSERVAYINGAYPETMEIRLNKLEN